MTSSWQQKVIDLAARENITKREARRRLFAERNGNRKAARREVSLYEHRQAKALRRQTKGAFAGLKSDEYNARVAGTTGKPRVERAARSRTNGQPEQAAA